MTISRIRASFFQGKLTFIMLLTGCNVVFGLVNLSISFQFLSYSDFGVWAVAFSIYNWIGTFGGGLGNQARNHYALAHRDGKDVQKVLIFKETFQKSAIVLVSMWLCWRFIGFVIDWESLFSGTITTFFLEMVVFLGLLNEWSKNANRFLFATNRGYATVLAPLLNNLLILIIMGLFSMEIVPRNFLEGYEVVAIALLYTVFAPFLNLTVVLYFFKATLFQKIPSKGALLEYKDGFWFVGFKVLSGLVLATLPGIAMYASGANAAGDIGILIRLYSLPLLIVTVFLQHEWLGITLRAFSKDIRKEFIWNTRLSLGSLVTMMVFLLIFCLQTEILNIWLRDIINIPSLTSFLVFLFFCILVIKRFLVTILQAINEIKISAQASLLSVLGLIPVAFADSVSIELLLSIIILSLLIEVIVLTAIMKRKASILQGRQGRAT